jgi:hydrogenase/urease accessory protein HupE
MRPGRDDTWRLPWRVALMLGLVWTPYAQAHVARGQATGCVTGFGHPWAGCDHVLARMAVGIWGAQRGAPRCGCCRWSSRWSWRPGLSWG